MTLVTKRGPQPADGVVTAAATPLSGVTLGGESSVLWLEVIDNRAIGRVNATSQIVASTDDGATYTTLATVSVTGIVGILPCADGEWLIVSGAPGADGGIWRSVGWATNPATATFNKVTAPTNDAFFIRWGVDGDGTKFIAAEYATLAAPGWIASRAVRISLDGGLTWATKFDSVTEFGEVDAADSHLHAACYDPWADRFWFSEGHREAAGIYYSDDDGDTWTRLTGGMADTIDPTPTVMVATDDGIVCGTDSRPSGVLGIKRTANPADMSLEMLYEWQDAAPPLAGFAQRGYRDPATGLVYMGFNSEYVQYEIVIAAGSASAAAAVWSAAPGLGRVWNQIVTPNGVLLSYMAHEGFTLREFRGAVPRELWQGRRV